MIAKRATSTNAWLPEVKPRVHRCAWCGAWTAQHTTTCRYCTAAGLGADAKGTRWGKSS